VDCSQTADWIWMPFGVMGRLGPKMRQVVEIGDCPTQGVILKMDVERPIL